MCNETILRNQGIVREDFIINKRCLHSSKNPHKMTLKQYLMNRSSLVSLNMFVWWLKVPCWRKQQLLFLRNLCLAASKINPNNCRIHQMKQITCSLRNFPWGTWIWRFVRSGTLMPLKQYGSPQKIWIIQDNFLD